MWPGVYSSSVEAAFGEGVPVTTPEGDDFSLHAFGRPGEVQCQGSNTLVYPQVVKPPPTQESLARSALSAAADAGQTINGHYRFYGFSQASDAPVPDAGGPAPIIGPDGTPQTYGNVATHCSSFPRYAAKSKPGGASLDANKLLPLPSSVGTGTPDGLFFYREDVRAAAGQAMYDYLYNMVDRQLMAMEAAADDYWWAGGAVAGAGIVVGAPALIIGGALGTVSLDTSGTLLKWATDAPDDVANQITNCFGSDYCSEGAKDSSNWKHPGDGITVSPDDIMNHYDAPIDGGLYGYHEQMVYRQKRYRPIFQWLPSPGTRTVAGTVYKDESGTLTPVADATVSILGQPDKVEGTDAAGLFSLEAVADGNLQVHAQKIVDGYLNEVDACYKPDADQPEFLRLVDCADFDTFLDATLYSEIALTLDLPSEDFRKVIIEGTVLVEDCDCCGFWTCSDLENRDFYEVCYVSPLDPGPKTFSVPASQLCSDEVGLTIAGTCELIPGTRDVRVEATVSLYEAGDGSCGGGEFESDEFWYADAAEGDTTPLWGDTVVNEGFCTSPLGPPFDCDDRGQFWDFNAQNVVAE